jgi:hypothetical protein
MTLNHDPRSSYDTRALLYLLEHGEKMPINHPYDRDTEHFTEIMSRYASQMNVYIYMKTKKFIRFVKQLK